ncbi:MAG: HAMP domain-containing protein [Deltaproteobacteria bacterium]|nr:HAMP domain-containing protein [Deltaproteobacteria bacterium]
MRRKIIIAISTFLILSGFIWSLAYYKHLVLNQKLQILEKKDNLFNTILEARRYEKNYFLYLGPENLQDALSYARKSEQKLNGIIGDYGRFTLATNLQENLDDLRKYENALSSLLELHQERGSPEVEQNLIEDYSRHQHIIRALGKKITEDMEAILSQERRYVNRLFGESRIYQFLTLLGVFVLSIFAVLFFVFSVNRPLKTIEDAIHKIAVGDYTNMPPISTGDEFESLVNSLNNMINELNRRSEQLVQTKKLASLGTLTSGVAHELNNPLNNISTSVQILLEELEEDNLEYKRELLIETEKQVERTRDIVKALLEFSRERSFHLKQLRFKILVDSTLKLIKGEVPANVELRVDVPEDIRVNLDPRRIQQVLVNLILNGIQAMEHGGILSIRAAKGKDKAEFYFQVSDTGSGIQAENLSKIFDPFFTTKEVGKGTGLGLSISHSIVGQHGGRIEVESEIDRGTTFTVFLPTDHDILESSETDED